MKNNGLTKLGITFTVTTLTLTCAYTSAYAKKIWPAEIMARDLNYYGLGWLGHVGIATTNMSSPAGMGNNADQVIEILNENPVGQVNSISNF